MISIHPQYIKDTAGKTLVILTEDEFTSLMEELEDIEDQWLYDEAKKNSMGESVPINEAFERIEAKTQKNFLTGPTD
jgi:PHD/YefM family antitoxin component YafN of YafNO toxin-antitoxin module